MKTLLLLLFVSVFVVGVLCQPKLDATFDEYISYAKKRYSSPEEMERRRAVYDSNMRAARQLQDDNPYAEFGPGPFSDLSPEEFDDVILMHNITVDKDEGDTASDVVRRGERRSLPSRFDWRTKGAVTPVKNQYTCGSCFAVTAAENIESVWNLSGNPLKVLSMQQVLDCDRKSYGCNGGLPTTSYNELLARTGGGMEAATTYPYENKWKTCRYDKSRKVASFSGWCWITKKNDEQFIKRWLVERAPISVCLDASSWQNYRGGVITSCPYRRITHCVLLVGYTDTTQTSVPAWILRNSWGTSWGDKGYLYVAIGNNRCGIASFAVSALQGSVTAKL